jgi:RNA polymerase sigma-70 factor (ECF subfamily)
MIKGRTPFQPELFRSRLHILARVALRDAGKLQNKIDASDVVQEALLQAVVALPQFQGQTDQEFAAWLRAILANKLTDMIRHFLKQKRDVALEETIRECLDKSAPNLLDCIVAPGPSPSQQMVLDERARILDQCLAALPPNQQTVVELHHLAGHTVAEIAKRMNKTETAVAGLLRRGLRTLRTAVKTYETEHQ